jgi:hypothetical protein
VRLPRTRSIRVRISSPRYSSIGGTSSENEPNQSPCTTAILSFAGLWSCMQKVSGMPPLPLIPILNATPIRSHFVLYVQA